MLAGPGKLGRGGSSAVTRPGTLWCVGGVFCFIHSAFPGVLGIFGGRFIGCCQTYIPELMLRYLKIRLSPVFHLLFTDPKAYKTLL